MDYKFVYISMGVLFAAVWLILFLWRKDTRKEMLLMSFIFTLPGPISEIAYVRDWWHPANLTNTKIPFIEDILFGFVIGGIATVIYEEIFNKNLKKQPKKHRKLHSKSALIMMPVLFFISFFIFDLNSFFASIIAFGISIIFVLVQRPDLITESLVTGLFILALAVIVYSVLEILAPGWVQFFWFFKNVPNLVIFNVPIDDIVWYFLAGAYIGPLYAYWSESSYIKSSAEVFPELTQST